MKKIVISLFFTFLVCLVIFCPVSLAKNRLIVWMYEDPLLNDAFMQIVKEYNKTQSDTEIVVEVQPGSLGDFHTKVQMALAAGRGPDIFYSEMTAVPNWTKNKWVLETPKNLVNKIKQTQASNIAFDAMFYHNKPYGIPYLAEWQVLFYRKDFFREAGINKPPSTFEEFIEDARKLTKYDANGNIIRSGWSVRKSGYQKGIADKWQVFFYLFGGRMFNENETKTLINSEAGYKAARLYHDAVNVWKVDDFIIEGDFTGLGKGTTAMCFRESFAIGYLQENFPNVEFGTAPVPAYNGYSTSVASADFLMVNAKTKYAKEAWDFISRVISSEAQLKLCRMTKRYPLYNPAAKDPEFAENELYKAWYSQKNVKPQTVIYRGEEILTILGAAIEKITRGLVPVKQGLDEAAIKINEILVESIN